MAAFKKKGDKLCYKGCHFFRQRLLLSTLSGKPVEISEIRSNDMNPGLKEYEVNLIRLLDKLTNGSKTQLSETGTTVLYSPGLLTGGTVTHECNPLRGIGYYLEVLVALAPFCKNPLNITLRGVTNSQDGPSVDHIKAVVLPALKTFILDHDDLQIKVNKRGMMPLGGGEVIFTCPIVKQLRPVLRLDPGKVSRIRGTVYACRCSPEVANRTMSAAKGVMLNFLPDVYIHTDQCKGPQGGKSPGFGINLVAETTTGVFYSSEQVSNYKVNEGDPSIPEELGTKAAHRLLDEIYRGGCVDSVAQSLVLLWMALGQKVVSKFITGPLSEFTITYIQHLREFFGITFLLENARSKTTQEGGEELDEDDDEALPGGSKVLITCLGVGYTNINKRVA